MPRSDEEQPATVATWGWRFHHVGVPTDRRLPGEEETPALGMFVSGFRTSAYGVEWMRFADDSAVHPPIRTRPHIAFVVDDLRAALADKAVIAPPSSPSLCPCAGRRRDRGRDPRDLAAHDRARSVVRRTWSVGGVGRDGDPPLTRGSA